MDDAQIQAAIDNMSATGSPTAPSSGGGVVGPNGRAKLQLNAKAFALPVGVGVAVYAATKRPLLSAGIGLLALALRGVK